MTFSRPRKPATPRYRAPAGFRARVPAGFRSRVPAGFRSRVPAVDLALAGAALAALVAEQLAIAPEPGERLPATLALSVVIAGCVAVRRWIPLTAYALSSVALSAEAFWGQASTVGPYLNLIGIYSLGLYGGRRRALWGPALVLPAVLAYFTAVQAPWSAPAGVVFVWLLAWGAGYSGARRRERQEAARLRLRQEAIAGERTRIAQELHDLVGHAVNLMLVRVGAARVVLDQAPEQTREILQGVEQTGREALNELDLMLGALRDGDEGATGRPGLAELPRLAQRMAEAGMEVSLRVETAEAVGDAATTADATAAASDPPLPGSLDLSAYRIVQEALTNALRHGKASAAQVSIVHDGHVLQVEICDDGRGPGPGYQPGRGLLGIGERATMFGGSLEHGPGPTGGFRVRAVLPLP